MKATTFIFIIYFLGAVTIKGKKKKRQKDHIYNKAI